MLTQLLTMTSTQKFPSQDVDESLAKVGGPLVGHVLGRTGHDDVKDFLGQLGVTVQSEVDINIYRQPFFLCPELGQRLIIANG